MRDKIRVRFSQEMCTPIKNSGIAALKSKLLILLINSFQDLWVFRLVCKLATDISNFQSKLFQIYSYVQAEFSEQEYGCASHLMVGCGNSKMSEEMATDGYPFVTNMDISPVVLHKMGEHYKQKGSFDFIALDATKMNFRDNSYDLCIDKGTFDALACGENREPLKNLLQEMNRVARVATVIITSGTPDRRMHYF